MRKEYLFTVDRYGDLASFIMNLQSLQILASSLLDGKSCVCVCVYVRQQPPLCNKNSMGLLNIFILVFRVGGIQPCFFFVPSGDVCDVSTIFEKVTAL